MTRRLITIALLFGGPGCVVAILLLLQGAPLRVAASFGLVTAFLLSFPAIHSIK